MSDALKQCVFSSIKTRHGSPASSSEHSKPCKGTLRELNDELRSYAYPAAAGPVTVCLVHYSDIKAPPKGCNDPAHEGDTKMYKGKLSSVMTRACDALRARAGCLHPAAKWCRECSLRFDERYRGEEGYIGPKAAPPRRDWVSVADAELRQRCLCDMATAFGPRADSGARMDLVNALCEALSDREKELIAADTVRSMKRGGRVVLHGQAGQPQVLQAVISPRVEEAELAPAQKRARRAAAKRLVKSAGGMCSEIEKVFDETCSLYVSAEDLAHVQGLLGLSLSRVGVMKQFLAALGVPAAPLREVRAAHEVFGAELESGTFDDGRVFVRVKNVKEVVARWTYEMAERKRLVQRRNIPPGEIWCKLAGDKGGNTVKLVLTCMNTTAPNSLDNTILLAMYEGDEDRESVARVFGRAYRELLPVMSFAPPESGRGVRLVDVEKEPVRQERNARVFSPACSICCADWPNANDRDKQPMQLGDQLLRVFVVGDMKFTSLLLGHMGQSCAHPCTHCHIESRAVKENAIGSPPATLRTTTTLLANGAKAERYTCESGNRPKGAQYCGIGNKPLLVVTPVETVAPFPLHLDLGISLKLLNALEDAAEAIDAVYAGVHNAADRVNAARAVARDSAEHARWCKSQVTAKFNKIMVLELAAGANSTSQWQRDLNAAQLDERRAAGQHRKARAALDGLSSELEPCSRELRQVVKQLGVQRQRYHGGALNGNDAGKLLAEGAIPRLVSCFRSCTDTDAMAEHREQLHTLARHFERTLAAYAQVRRVLLSTVPLCYHQVSDFRERVSKLPHFLSTIGSRFCGPKVSLTPKVHVLCAHVYQWLMRYGSVGMFSEQPMEATHHEVNVVVATTNAKPRDERWMKTEMEAVMRKRAGVLKSRFEQRRVLCAQCGQETRKKSNWSAVSAPPAGPSPAGTRGQRLWRLERLRSNSSSEIERTSGFALFAMDVVAVALRLRLRLRDRGHTAAAPAARNGHSLPAALPAALAAVAVAVAVAVAAPLALSPALASAVASALAALAALAGRIARQRAAHVARRRHHRGRAAAEAARVGQ